MTSGPPPQHPAPICYLPPVHENRGRSRRRDRCGRHRGSGQGARARGAAPGSADRADVLSLGRRSLPEDRRDRAARRIRRALLERRHLHGGLRRSARPGHAARRGHPARSEVPAGPLRELSPGALSRRPSVPSEGLRRSRHRLCRLPREHGRLLRRSGRAPEEGYERREKASRGSCARPSTGRRPTAASGW
jgi:hypothetical protein